LNHIQLTRVVSTVDSAVLSASGTVRASSGVPGVTVVAVGVSTGDVGPAPVRVKYDRTGLGGAAGSASASACLPGQLGVGLRSDRASLLGAGSSEEREGSKSERPVHGCCDEEDCCRILREFAEGRAYVLYSSVATNTAPLSVRSQCTHMISNYSSVQVIIILGWPHVLSPILDGINGSSDHKQC
jgi:hypothetical protein